MHNHVLFEVATEVANRVGGIYSVLKSKAQVTTAEYGSSYTLLGPLNRASAAVEVEEIEPRDPAMIATLKSMNERGIKTMYGRWLIDGAPRVLLFDTGTGYYKLDEWKGDLWSTAGIPSPPDDHETNEAIVFGYLIAWFLGEVRYTFFHLSLTTSKLIFHSTSSTRRSAPSLHNSTNGSQVLHFLCAKSGRST